MNILGISAHYHDSAAALVVGGVPVCAVQEERLSRHKGDTAFPLLAIESCLQHAGIEPNELDAVVFYERPMLKFDRILTCALRAFPHSWRAFPKAMKNSLGEKVWMRGIISSHLGVPGRKVLFTEHHQSHAAAAFLTAPTRCAAILTADGVGEWATLTVGHGERRATDRTDITLLREIRFPHSLGMLYSTFTAYLGFAVNEDEYKVMALAAYGRPTLMEQVRKLIRRTPDGAFALNLDYFEYQSPARRSYSSRFVDLFGPPRNAYEPIDLETPEGRRFADCAASVQRVLEDTLVDIAHAVHQETGLTDLCLGGRVVGWIEGACEFGPRALGHRSILAAPHSAEMRDRLNRDIKYREEFRPFAPVTPVETADRYFELPPGGARLARYMSGVFPVRPEWRAQLAAVTHVDGSARVQTLDREMAPRLY